MAAIPYIPLYISDYLADTAGLSTLEHGAYLLLIFNYWQTGKPLPDDVQILARIARCELQKFKKIYSRLKVFFISEDAVLHHKRLDMELAKFKEKSELARLAGKKSGEKRRQKNERTFNGRSTDAERTPNHTDTDTEISTETTSPPISPSLYKDEQEVHLCPNSQNASVGDDVAILKKERKIPNCPYDQIVKLYHETLPSLPEILVLSASRKRAIQARWREYPDVEAFKTFFHHVKHSNFLMGRVQSGNRPPFKCTIDWMMNPNNFVKIIEDKYS